MNIMKRRYHSSHPENSQMDSTLNGIFQDLNWNAPKKRKQKKKKKEKEIENIKTFPFDISFLSFSVC